MKLITPLLILALLLVAPVAQDSHLEELIARVATLTEQLRASEVRNVSLQAQIDELMASPAVPQKQRWFGYVSPSRRGAYDMLDVSSWEGVKIESTTGTNRWTYLVRLRTTQSPILLTDEMFKDFAIKFDSYLSNNP